jgi:HSP20 family molecular chaperone IbpA
LLCFIPTHSVTSTDLPQLLGTSAGSARVPLAMPMDLYRSGDHYVLHADLPGVDLRADVGGPTR